METAFDARAHHEERGGGAVVGATAFIFARTPAKFGKRHRGHLSVETMRFEVALESGEAVGELREKVRMREELPAVSVETAQRDEIDPCRQPAPPPNRARNRASPSSRTR